MNGQQQRFVLIKIAYWLGIGADDLVTSYILADKMDKKDIDTQTPIS